MTDDTTEEAEPLEQVEVAPGRFQKMTADMKAEWEAKQTEPKDKSRKPITSSRTPRSRGSKS